MKRYLAWLMAVIVLLGIGAAAYHYFHAPKYGAGNGRYRTMAVRRGDIVVVVNSTGTVQPVLSVQVGAFVSGPVQKVNVDFNAKVKAGQILAQIDPRTYRAAVAHGKASLARSQADLLRVKALLAQAIRTEKRGLLLQPAKAISETDLDQSVTDRHSLEAQVKLAEAAIQECEADLATVQTNLEFTDIKSPVDGIIIDRKVDPGQTVASQFQTPVLFVVAPDLEKKVYVYASVDEADIGLIRDAQARSQPVTFTVDAYPKDLFQGRIAQVRLNPSTVQNVVTYTVVVESPNTQLKLLPGMTASLSFQIEKHVAALTIPNAALRFYPKSEQVSPQDRPILEGVPREPQVPRGGGPAETTNAGDASATGRSHNPNEKYVWVAEDDLLSAVPIVTGLSDKNATELVSGELSEGQELVVGMQTGAAKASSPPP